MKLKIWIVWILTFNATLAVASDSFSEQDPWEPVNRVMFNLNGSLDTFVFRPVARAYLWAMPTYGQARVTGMFMNLGEVRNMANNALQGKLGSAGVDFSRFLINSTVGLLGMYDVASHWGLERSDEDFGQTLAVWGVPAGPYMVIPITGPATVRDATGAIGEYWLDPVTYMEERSVADKINIARFIELRARFISVEGLATGDDYTFIRNAYLQRRDFLINDGQLADEWDEWDDEWDDDEDLD